MKRLYRQNEEESNIDITPMLDIVFIMLIFFVVTTSFVKESGIDVNRPTASTSERKETGNILVAISDDNNVWIDKRRVDPDAIRPNIERLHAENPGGAVVIQADKQSTSGLLVKVMDQIRLAGVSNISIAAQPGQD
ncbi:MAG: biopolymer transporter ExbD [Thioalkalispiraceae bacterium]|jgi:biopolymer transport protein ExbD